VICYFVIFIRSRVTIYYIKQSSSSIIKTFRKKDRSDKQMSCDFIFICFNIYLGENLGNNKTKRAAESLLFLFFIQFDHDSCCVLVVKIFIILNFEITVQIKSIRFLCFNEECFQNGNRIRFLFSSNVHCVF
jgi:hypothetical protein